MNRFILFLLFILSCSENNKEGSDNYPIDFNAFVIGISDGDTIKLLYKESQIKLRLEHIDCPEKKQPYGNSAKMFVSNLIFNKTVTIKSNGKKDRYGRLIGEVYTLEGENINKLLVKSGLALHFKKYSKDKSYSLLEKYAKDNKIGMWTQPDIIEPWIFRKRKK